MQIHPIRLSYVFDRAHISYVIPVEQTSPELACAVATEALMGLFSGISNIRVEVAS